MVQKYLKHKVTVIGSGGRRLGNTTAGMNFTDCRRRIAESRLGISNERLVRYAHLGQKE
jgi:hypothetical protein